jgi:hypothetical protein
MVPATEEEVKSSTEQNFSLNPRPYMEKQEKAFCLVQSFNMAVGEHIISGNGLLAHIQKMEDTLGEHRLR